MLLKLHKSVIKISYRKNFPKGLKAEQGETSPHIHIKPDTHPRLLT